MSSLGENKSLKQFECHKVTFLESVLKWCLSAPLVLKEEVLLQVTTCSLYSDGQRESSVLHCS